MSTCRGVSMLDAANLGRGTVGEGPSVNPDTTLLSRISRRHHSRAEAGKAERDISAVRQRPTAFRLHVILFTRLLFILSYKSESWRESIGNRTH